MFTLISVSGCSLPSTRSKASSAPERLGLGQPALGLIERGQIVHASKRVGVFLAQHPLAGLAAALNRAARPRRGWVGQGQIVHTCKRVGVLLAQHPLEGFERALMERLSLGQPPLGS